MQLKGSLEWSGEVAEAHKNNRPTSVTLEETQRTVPARRIDNKSRPAGLWECMIKECGRNDSLVLGYEAVSLDSPDTNDSRQSKWTNLQRSKCLKRNYLGHPNPWRHYIVSKRRNPITWRNEILQNNGIRKFWGCLSVWILQRRANHSATVCCSSQSCNRNLYLCCWAWIDVTDCCWVVFRRFRKIVKKRLWPSSCLSFYLSAWNNLAPTERIFMKLDIWVFFENLSWKFEFHKHLTWITGTLCED